MKCEDPLGESTPGKMTEYASQPDLAWEKDSDLTFYTIALIMSLGFSCMTDLGGWMGHGRQQSEQTTRAGQTDQTNRPDEQTDHTRN